MYCLLQIIYDTGISNKIPVQDFVFLRNANRQFEEVGSGSTSSETFFQLDNHFTKEQRILILLIGQT